MKNKELSEYRQLMFEKANLERRLEEIEVLMNELENIAHQQLIDENEEFNENDYIEINYIEEIDENE